MKRALAVLVALAMVGIAFVIRSGSDASSDEVRIDDEEVPTAPQPVDTSLEVACIEETSDACRGAGLGATDDFEDTYRELTTVEDPSVDVWVVVDPWPQIVDAERANAGFPPIMGSSIPLGSTTFRSYGVEQLVASSSCAAGGKVTMSCLLAEADRTIGRSIGVRDPNASATGAMALAEISAQLGGSSASDLRALGLAAQTSSYDSPLDHMSLVGQAAFTLTVDLASEAEAVLANTRNNDLIADVLDATPTVPVVVRIVEIGDGVSDDELSDLAGSIQPSLVQFGWSAETSAAGPDAATVIEFRILWEEIAR